MTPSVSGKKCERKKLSGMKMPTDLNQKLECGPTQPRLANFPKTWYLSQNRSFSVSTYAKYDFIEYSIERDAVFCFCCRMFPTPDSEVAFTEYGCNNWKDIRACVKGHARGTPHLNAYARWKGAKSVACGETEAVLLRINRHAAEIVEKNRSAVASLARIALTCARQDIALRGHTETGPDCGNVNRGNFLEIVELVKFESNVFKTNIDRLPKNASYCSKDSQNELLQSAADVIKQKIIEEVRASGMYAVIADESRDISKTEQMSICLRYVSGDEIRERFLRFVPVADLSAANLASVLANSLKCCGLELTNCVAQCYDGASVMSGQLHGVQERFRALCQSPCIYVHCYAHRVNLVLVDSCNAVQPAGDLFGLLEAVHNFLTVSSIRHEKFVTVQKSRGEKVMELPLQSDTRWVCKLKAVNTFKDRFESVVTTLQYLCESKKSRERVEARGLLSQLQSESTLFMLHLFQRLLSITNCLSTYCQSKDATMSAACTLVKSTDSSLAAMRSDAIFDEIYCDVLQQCCAHGIETSDGVSPLQPRHKRSTSQSTRFSDSIVMSTLGQRLIDTDAVGSNNQSVSLSSKNSLRKLMFETIDCMRGELESRFSSTHPFLISCDTINPKSDVFLVFDSMKPLAEAYGYLGIDIEKLKSQAVVAKNMFQADLETASCSDVLKTLCKIKSAFPDLTRYAALALTMPVSSAGAERSFSAMKRVKSYLRSTMADTRLSNLCLISIERSLSSELLKDPTSVIDEFVKHGNRRLSLTT